jgi:hypothetical protein
MGKINLSAGVYCNGIFCDTIRIFSRALWRQKYKDIFGHSIWYFLSDYELII